MFFPDFEQKFWSLGQKISVSLSKQHSACLEEQFGDFFSKHFTVFFAFLDFQYKSFGLRAKTLRTFGEKFSAWLLKLRSTCPEEHFGV